jgi:uncharacterized membrane protein YfcA
LPTPALLSLMGMSPRLCFPIMAAGAGLAMTGASVRRLKDPALDLRLVVGLAIGGAPAVLVAAFVVKAMPMEALRWLVVAMVVSAELAMACRAVRASW